MKSLSSTFLFLFLCLSLQAQNLIVPLTERGYISCEKGTYKVGDTLTVRGAILSTDYNDFYPYSRYVNVELINNTDSVCISQKVPLSENGYFYATLPTTDIHYQGKYFLRAYTQFMCNLSPGTFPMNFVDLTKGDRLSMKPFSSSSSSSSHKINIKDLGSKLQISVAGADSGMELYCFQSGFGLIKLNVQPGKAISFATSEIPDGMLTFWLRKNNQTLDERIVWVGAVHNHRISLSSLENNAIKPIVIKRIVEDNSSTLHAFESLNILQHVHSSIPFPESFYHVPADSAKVLLNNWLSTAHFIGFDLQKAIDGSFEYPYSPEKVLSLKGTAKRKSKKLLENGTVEILNVLSLDNHICPIDSTGHYSQVVADFPVGSRFFLEAKNKRGKGSNNMVTWDDPTPPLVENWLPSYYNSSVKDNYSDSFLSPVNIDINTINLDEVTIKADRLDPDFGRKSKLTGIYVFDYKELQRNVYRDLKSVLEHSGMIEFTYDDTTFGGAGVGSSDVVPSDMVAVWRTNRNQSFNSWGVKWMKILYDNVLYSHGYGSLFDIPADEFESIEIIRPSTSDPRLVINDAQNGLVILKSNHCINLGDIPSNGITIQPKGISYPLQKDADCTLIPKPGQHIAVDVITSDRQIISWEE